MAVFYDSTLKDIKPDTQGQIRLPGFINQLVSTEIQSLCNFVFPPELLGTASTFRSRAILTMRNTSVTGFNSLLLSQMPGKVYTFNATNSTDSLCNGTRLTVEGNSLHYFIINHS